MEGPEIFRSKVRAAMTKIRRNKVTRPDETVIEMVTALDDFGIEVTEVINEMCTTSEIPKDLNKQNRCF